MCRLVDGAHNARFLRRLVQLSLDAEASGQVVIAGAQRPPSTAAPANGTGTGGAATAAAGAGGGTGNGRNYLRRPPRSRYFLAFLRYTLDLRKLFRRWRRRRNQQQQQQQQNSQATASGDTAQAPGARLDAIASDAPSSVGQPPASVTGTSAGVTNAAFTSSSTALNSDSLEASRPSPLTASAQLRHQTHAHQQFEGRIVSETTFSPAAAAPIGNVREESRL